MRDKKGSKFRERERERCNRDMRDKERWNISLHYDVERGGERFL